jgi:pyruvate/2-oxoglutarate dehydrogenase complex dihydrolipoamide dehydrogenase (E3) component
MTQPLEFDVVVVGAGPAGTAAALRAADLNAKTALVTRAAFGGMAANDGPIPVRTLAHVARLAREARQLRRYGIVGDPPALNFARLVARAREVVAEARDHSTLLNQITKAGVTLFEQAGSARFLDPNTVSCERAPTLRAENIILCCGGVSRPLSGPGSELAITPADVFLATVVPESLIVIGAGATGVQVASIFNALGTHVTICQSGPRIIPTEDADVSCEVARCFRENGIDVWVEFGKIDRLERTQNGVRMVMKDDPTRPFAEADAVVSAIGWVADAKALNLPAAGVKTNQRGFIEVDARLRTSAPHIYAAGDILGHSMLVPQAVRDGYIAGSNAVKHELSKNQREIEPIGSFTDPEYAKVGMTEKEAKAAHDVLAVRATYAETTRAIIDGRTRGFCKLVVDREDLTLLGCHIVGERAVEVVQMATLAMTAGLKVDDLARVLFSFPTYANVLGRAALRATRELRKGGYLVV